MPMPFTRTARVLPPNAFFVRAFGCTETLIFSRATILPVAKQYYLFPLRMTSSTHGGHAMAIGYFVDGKRVNPHAPGDLLSADAVAHLHGEDFTRTFGAEMFRRLPLAQQAAVLRAWADAYSARTRERSKAFEALLGPIFSGRTTA
jgi:hypothetical protein